jgi:hypothetical protein
MTPTPEELAEALRTMLGYLNGGEPPVPDHSCGPESMCDVLCMDWGWYVKEKANAAALLARWDKGQEAVCGECGGEGFIDCPNCPEPDHFRRCPSCGGKDDEAQAL